MSKNDKKRGPAAPISARNRSAITNASKLLHDVDGRSREGRRFRDLVNQFADDLGGAHDLAAAEMAIVRNAAAITLRSEMMAAAIVRGEPVDDAEVVRLANVASRLLRTLMAKRAKRRTGPSLEDYLATKGESRR